MKTAEVTLSMCLHSLSLSYSTLDKWYTQDLFTCDEERKWKCVQVSEISTISFFLFVS